MIGLGSTTEDVDYYFFLDSSSYPVYTASVRTVDANCTFICLAVYRN